MKIIRKGREAREALKRGVDLVADCVKVTLGPAGRNAVLGRLGISPEITNDGVTIAQNIESDDEVENLGVMIAKEASMLTDLNGGDGTTTTMVLLQALIREQFAMIGSDDGSFVQKKADIMQIVRRTEDWSKKVVGILKENARPVSTKELYNVAFVSAEWDWIAKMVSEIYQKIGKDGYVTIESGVKNEYEVHKGIELKAGFLSEYFINTPKREVLVNDPYIFVTNQAMDIYTFLPLIEAVTTKQITNLVMIAPDYTKDLLARLVTTKLKAPNTNYIALRLPTYDKDEVLFDIAALTGAKFMDKGAYPSLDDFAKDLKVENLGRTDKAIIRDSTSVLIGGSGDTTARVEELRKQKAKMRSVFDKDQMDKRIAHLSGGFAIIRVGGESDTERTYFRRKIEDAVNAVDAALKEGVVKGGGLALKEIADQTKEMVNVLRAPYEQIQENAGGSLDIKDTVVDPVLITTAALKSAVSLANMLITTEVAVAYKNEDKTQNHADPES